MQSLVYAYDIILIADSTIKLQVCETKCVGMGEHMFVCVKMNIQTEVTWHETRNAMESKYNGFNITNM